MSVVPLRSSSSAERRNRASTNRHGNAPVSPSSDRRFGIDTVAVRIKVREDILDGLVTSLGERRVDVETGEILYRPFASTAGLPDGLGEARFSRSRDGEVYARVEGSVPRVLFGSNVELASADETRALIDEWVRAVDALTDGGVTEAPTTLSRLDVALNFSGETEASSAQLLRALADERPRRVPTPPTKYLHELGGVTSLVHETQAWRVTSYLKHTESLSATVVAPPGTVRVELMQRYRALQENGLVGIAGLTDELTAEAHRAYFERLRLDTVVGGGYEKLARADSALRAAGKGRDRNPLLGHLAAEGLGLERSSDPKTRLRYNRLADQLGLRPADLVNPELAPTYLDWSARLVVHSTRASLLAA